MSTRFEYVDPQRITFVNDIDLVAINGIDGGIGDTDCLVLWYDEAIVIPVGDKAGARDLVTRILAVLDQHDGERATRIRDDEFSDDERAERDRIQQEEAS